MKFTRTSSESKELEEEFFLLQSHEVARNHFPVGAIVLLVGES